MTGTDSFNDLMSRLQQRDEEAVNEICGRYQAKLRARARQTLDARVRRLVEPDEIVHSALKSFFLREREGEFQLNSWGELWALIVKITTRKCLNRNEYFLAAMRDVRRDQPQSTTDEMSVAWQAYVREPSPEEAVIAADLVEELMRRLPTQRNRDIIVYRLQGFSIPETAAHFGCSERTVERTVSEAKQILSAIYSLTQ